MNLYLYSIYKYIWTGYIDRYHIIAEGLLFIVEFEKLPCFNNKKEEEEKEQI